MVLLRGTNMNKIENVYIFSNGMALVIDEAGNQTPELQGKWAEVKEEVEAAILKQRIQQNANWDDFRRSL